MAGNVVVKVVNLKKYFELRRGFLSMWEKPSFVKAVDDVNIDIHEGEILGLVGESGCGKTTTGRLLTRLETPTGGSVFFLGRDIALLEGYDLKVFRRNIQMVFQDPYESLNPRTTVLQTVIEPLVNHHIGKSLEERTKMCVKALEDAGLAPGKEYLNRFPHELSGGQRQRVSIARALVINPRVIVADEPVSMLDVSIRAGVLNLMLDLRDKYKIPYLFITHDIAVARYVSDRLAVMYLGRVVELGETDETIFGPKHPYTRALLSAVPVPDPQHKHGRITIKGEVSSAINIPLGCRFRPRCPLSFNECGWEGKDLAAFLTEDENIMDPSGPLSSHIAEMVPNEFALIIKVKPGGNARKLKEGLDSIATEHKESVPMFQALSSIDEMLGDRELMLPTSSVSLSPEDLAKSFREELTRSVDFRNSTHPMFGIILAAKLDGGKVELSIGQDKQGTPNEQGKVETTVGFIKDFIKHLVAMGSTEYRGVSKVSAGTQVVLIECVHGRMSSKRVANVASEMITKDILDNPMSRFYNAALPVDMVRGGIRVRVIGNEQRWSEIAAELRDYFASKSSEGVRAAGGVHEPKTRKVKGTKRTVVATFKHTLEPPLVDVGKGHKVACYLFKQVSE
jgi:peptide/nickel transport system ATP-binding protein